MKYIQYFVYIIIGICLCNLILNIVIQYSPGTHIMFPYLVISPLILIQTPHLIILLKIPTPLIFL